LTTTDRSAQADLDAPRPTTYRRDATRRLNSTASAS